MDFNQKDKYQTENLLKKRGFTENEFQIKLKKIHGSKYITLEKYINSEQKINVKCIICDTKWLVRTSHLLSGSGCPICSKNKRTKTTEQFIMELKNLNDNYTLMCDYINAQTKVVIKCKNCDNIWSVKPTHLISSKSQCPKCSGKKRSLDQRKTNEQFLIDFKKVHNNKYEIIGNYTNAKTPIEIKCNKCNFEWKSTPNSLLNGCGCPSCNQSKGEEEIKKFLDLNQINYIYQYKNGCKDKYTLRFDFGIFDKNNNLFCILEYDGIQHFKSIFSFGGENDFIETIRKDNIKNEYCQLNNIRLHRIPYTQKNKIDNVLKTLFERLE